MSEPLPQPKVVNLVDQATGDVVNVDEADLGSVGEGYRLASPEEVQADLDRQQYGTGFGNELAAGVEGALSGATLGLSDVAARAISDDYAEGLAKRREYNPTAAGVGEGLGIIGATLLTGGAEGAAAGGLGAARTGLGAARLATAPTRALIGAGEAITSGAGRLLGTEAATSVLGRAAREGLSYGAGGAVEGALFGAAKTATDDYLHDHEITAERILAGSEDGALWGGGLGGGMGVIGSLAGSGARKLSDLWNRSDAEKAATRELESAISGEASGASGAGTSGSAEMGAAFDAGVGAEAEATAGTLTQDQKLLQQIGYQTDDQVMAELTIPTNPERVTALEKVRGLAEQADAAKRYEGLKAEQTGNIVKKVEELRRIQDEFDSYINRGQKRTAAKHQADVAPPDWTPDKVERVIGELNATRDRFQKMRSDSFALDSTQHAAMKDVVDLADELEARLKGFTGRKASEQVGPIAPDALVNQGATSDAIADVFDLHDRFKSALGRAQRKAGKSTPGHVNSAEAAIQRDYMVHRNVLEDEGLYGKGIAEMQRATNAAESEAISYARAWDDLFGLPEGQQTQRAGQYGFDKLSEASHPKIRNLLDTVGDDPQKERTFVLGLQRQADLLKVKGDYYSMPPAVRQKALRAKQLADEIVGTVREVKATRQLADEYAAALNDLKEIPLYGEQLAKLKLAFGRTANIMAGATSEARAMATGGTARARSAAGMGAAIDGRVGTNSAAQSAVRASVRGEQSVGKAASGFVQALRKAGDALGTGAKRVYRTASDISKSGPLLGVAFSANKPESYERLIRNVGALRDPNSDERKELRVRAFPLRQQNRRLADAIEAQTQKVGDFLSAKAGALSAQPKVGDPFGHLRKPRHDAAKAERLARYVDAATNPKGVLERVGSGEILREDMEVLSTLYPRLYQRVRDEVLMNLSKVDELPSYEARLKLGNLMNTPTDPSMRPEMVQALQQVARSGIGAKAAQEEQQTGAGGEPVLSPSQRKAPESAKIFATQTDAQSVMGSRIGG